MRSLLRELSLPLFHAFVLLTCIQAAAAGVDPGKQGDNHHHSNITAGGEPVTSTALAPFAFPGEHVSHGYLRDREMAPSSPSSSSSVSGALRLACLPGPGHRICLLMMGEMAIPRLFSCSGGSPRASLPAADPWLSSACNASSSAAALLHKHGGSHVAGAQSICKEVPICSFQHPPNVLLPGMRLGKDLWSGTEYVDWKSMWRRRRRSWRLRRTGPWNGSPVDGFPIMREFQVTTSWGGPADVKVTLGYLFWLEASFSLATAGEDGALQRTVWEATTYGSLAECAAFALMRNSSDAAPGGTSPSSFCICLNASRPVSPMHWETPPGSSRRLNASLDYCGRPGRSVVAEWEWDDAQHHRAASKVETSVCRLRCTSNSTCLAFAAVQRGEESRCITWSTPQGYSRTPDKFGSEPWLFLKPLFPDSSWAFVVVTILLIAPAFCLISEKRIKKWRIGIPCPESSSVNTGVGRPQDSTSIASVAFMDFSTVEKATRKFSKRNIIGEGGFAIVYKGKLSKHHILAKCVRKGEIAVKRLKQSAVSLKGSDDFGREVELMSKLSHARLVRLIAYCVEGDERILVYEYMQNMSLDRYIFGTRRLRTSMKWGMRLEIIHGIAQGVSYLHDGSGQNVIHRDLKPSNVLLDHQWTPKIADFGSTKLLVADDTGTQTLGQSQWKFHRSFIDIK